jgi:hypothetical protein
LRAHSYAEAVQLDEHALSPAEHAPERDELQIANLCMGRAKALFSAGKLAPGRAACERAIELACAHGLWDAVVAATGLLRPSVLFPPQAEPKLVAAIEAALAAVPESATAVRARLLARLALLPPHASSIEKSESTSLAAVQLARESDDQGALQEALRARLFPLSGPDRIDDLLEASSELLRLETGDGSFWSAQAHLARYQAFTLRGDLLQADIELEAYGKIAERLHRPAARWEYERLRAQRILQNGELDRAEARFDELRQEADRLGLAGADAYHMAQRYALELERGDVRALLERATLVEANDAWRAARPQAGFRSVAMLRSIDCGDSAEAKRELSALMMDACKNVPKDARYLGTLVRLSLGAVELRDPAAANELYRQLAPYESFNALAGSELWFGAVAYYLAMLARFLERPAHAEEHAEQAVRMNERIGYRTQAVRSRLMLSKLLRDSGNPMKRKRAAEVAAEAHAEAQALGLPALMDRAARLK